MAIMNEDNIANTQDDALQNNRNNNYYFIDKTKIYEPLLPSPSSNLIALYGLNDISKSVARTNPDGSKGVKLRKSYKNHIADLPGRHNIQKEHNLSMIAFAPRAEDNSSVVDIKPLDDSYLKSCLNFEKTPLAGIPGFDVSQLGMDDSGNDERRKKRKDANNTDSGDVKRRHIA
ncbi:hypothetical protein PACTADRAFT_1766 [Pachysolen tannophilus NRRL Y-2460]|uniref:Mediator of RNA polymerase II transcription subunit 19 n=1 Tax=Pachysolen tannophilus NRRL Y-2460 TaxID=669874 RepID=A0A1E4TZM0_PACTA|nr:hypothetical protein PACTADRAFT_1766 [Pachysolen tannophilus NRRL Y-2460]